MTKKDACISNQRQLQNHSLRFNLKNESLLSATSLPSDSPMAYNTTASLDKLTCTNYVDLGKCLHSLGQFFGPKMLPTTWIQNSQSSRKTAAKSSDWSKILQWERQILISLCKWGISWSMQQKALREREIWPHCWYLQCPKTRMNNSIVETGRIQFL